MPVMFSFHVRLRPEMFCVIAVCYVNLQNNFLPSGFSLIVDYVCIKLAAHTLYSCSFPLLALCGSWSGWDWQWVGLGRQWSQHQSKATGNGMLGSKTLWREEWDYGNGYVNAVVPYKVMFWVLIYDWLTAFNIFDNVHWFPGLKWHCIYCYVCPIFLSFEVASYCVQLILIN